MHQNSVKLIVKLTVIDPQSISTAKVCFSIENRSDHGNHLEAVTKRPLRVLFHAKIVLTVLLDGLDGSCNGNQTIEGLIAFECLHLCEFG